jgi:dTDP-glucose 4,6-dehydratase
MSDKFVVIGSNSFSGSNFVDYLLKEGGEVIGISRSSEPAPVFLPYRWKGEPSKFSFHALDLNHDLKQIMEVINDNKPDYIINFAAQGMVAESWEKPEDWFNTNTLSNVKLHDQLRKCDFLKKYVHVSTPEVYGTCEGLVNEHTNYNPSTPYAVSRAAADLSLMSFFKAYQFPVVFTRAANVYGPGQQLYRIIPRTIIGALTGKKLQLHGGGHSVRAFIHIHDVARGTLDVARKGTPGEIYHFSTKENVSIRSIVENIIDQLEVSFEDNVEVVGERLGKDKAYLLNTKKAYDELGWQAEISMEQGIKETVSWVKENLEDLKAQPLSYIHKQ